MCNLFNIAYFLAKEQKPLSDMESQCALAVKLGVDIGSNYHNDLSASNFTGAISENLKEDTVSSIKNCNYLCLLSDGSTDISVLEQEFVYVRYINNAGVAETVMANIIELEHAHAKGVLDGIKVAIKDGLDIDFGQLAHDKPGPSLVCANFDGASVMQGLKGGVVGLIKREIPNFIPMHCVAHKLELAILDCVKHLPFLTKYDSTIKGLFIMYRSSPKRLHELKEISSVLESDLSRFTDLKKTRWVSSKGRAVAALQKNLHAVTVHLDAMASANQAPEASGYLNVIKTQSFIKTMYIMLDFIPLITKVSQVFQYRDIMVYEVEDQLEGLLLELLSMKSIPRNFMHLRSFVDLLDVKGKKFGEITLKGPVSEVHWKEDNQLASLIDNTAKYIEKRFQNFKEKPLSCFKIFDYSLWPTEKDSLIIHGDQELTDLLSFFEGLFSDEEQEAIKHEFPLLKAYLRGRHPKDMKQTYEHILAERPTRLSHIVQLLEIMSVISPSSAECERGSSRMKSLKSATRNCLSQNSLQNLMRVSIYGPPVEQYNPQRDNDKWLSKGGTKHVKGHKISPAFSLPRKQNVTEYEPGEK